METYGSNGPELSKNLPWIVRAPSDPRPRRSLQALQTWHPTGTLWVGRSGRQPEVKAEETRKIRTTAEVTEGKTSRLKKNPQPIQHDKS